MTFGSRISKAISDLRPFTTMELIWSFVPNNQTLTELFNTQMSHNHYSNNHNMNMNLSNTSGHNYIPQFLKDLRNVKNVSVSLAFLIMNGFTEDVSVGHQDYEYLCCLVTWPNTEFKITLKKPK